MLFISTHICKMLTDSKSQRFLISHLFTFHGSILVTTTLGYINCQTGNNCGYNRLTHMRVYSRKKKKIQYSGQTNIMLTCEAYEIGSN